jgi:hypothetical protein
MTSLGDMPQKCAQRRFVKEGGICHRSALRAGLSLFLEFVETSGRPAPVAELSSFRRTMYSLLEDSRFRCVIRAGMCRDVWGAK